MTTFIQQFNKRVLVWFLSNSVRLPLTVLDDIILL